MKKSYWLMKSEPDVFSINDLQNQKKSLWDGVRNYQARNYMMKDMQIGDEVLFYHSNADETGIAGLAIVSKAAQPDPSQYLKKSEYYDPKATLEKPIWFCVEVTFKKKFPFILTLAHLKKDPKLKDMLVVKKGQRLSVQPVSELHFAIIQEHYAT